jgi:hypothetical protein
MQEWMQEREAKLRQFFSLRSEVDLLRPDVTPLDLPPRIATHLARFNLEWHIIPAAEAVRFDEAYVTQMYPLRSRDFGQPHLHGPSYWEVLARGHSRHQGRIIAIETTPKPHYLPGNRQHYGTPYGFDVTADPFAVYMGRARFASGTRYGHTYASLQELGSIVNEHWRAQELLPPGYRVGLCPPAAFNLIGTVFHPEWSATETLELGFYRDENENATCYAVGCNAPGDFSYIRALETSSDWTLLGFRAALVPV